MWYVIQTVTGKEWELVKTLDKTVSDSALTDGPLYEKCFILRRECSWRTGGEYKLHLETLFPGYVFVITDKPSKLFYTLKKIPGFARLLGEDAVFWTVRPDEQEFLENLINGDPDYIVRRSRVEVDGDGRILQANGPLGHYIDRIVKQRLRKRCVYVETELAGRMHRVLLGITVQGETAAEKENLVSTGRC